MKDKTKEQLIDELSKLRKRIGEFEKTEAQQKKAEEALREREKKNIELYLSHYKMSITAQIEKGE